MVARVSPVWSLPAAVVLPLVGIVLALLGLFAISEWSLRQLERNSSRFESAVEVSKLIEQWRAAVLDAESGQLGYLLTRDTAYLQPLTSAAERLPAVMQALQERAQGDAQLSALVADLSVPARLKFDNLAHTLRAMRAGDYERALDLVRSGEGQHSIGEMRRRFARLEAYAAERAELAQAARHQSNMIARIALLLATLVVAGLVFKLLQLFAADAARREQGRLADKLRRDELEREVDARTRELSSLSSHLQSVAESEKSELARELHDQMGGLLTAAKMDLAWLRERPQINDDHEYKQKLVGLGTVLDQAMGVKRRVVESLRPSLLEHFGLSVALQAYFEDECRKAGLECVATLPDELPGLDRSVQLAIFRIAQEALTNIVRHAKARHVELVLEQSDAGYQMVIGDDGAGFDSTRIDAQTAHGLAGMRQRVVSLHGSFTLHRQTPPGHGMRVIVTVPRDVAALE